MTREWMLVLIDSIDETLATVPERAVEHGEYRRAYESAAYEQQLKMLRAELARDAEKQRQVAA